MNTYNRLSAVAPLHPLGYRSIDPRGKTPSRTGQEPHNSQEDKKKARMERKKRKQSRLLSFLPVFIFSSLIRF
jgi:hypothetical protein